MRKLDIAKRWAPVAGMAILLAAVAMAFLLVPIYVINLLHDTSAPVSASPSVAAEQTPAEQTPRESAALYQDPDDPRAHQPAASPAPQPGVPSSPDDSSPSATEQRLFKSRTALETVSPREFLQQATTQK